MIVDQHEATAAAQQARCFGKIGAGIGRMRKCFDRIHEIAGCRGDRSGQIVPLDDVSRAGSFVCSELRLSPAERQTNEQRAIVQMRLQIGQRTTDAAAEIDNARNI